MSFPGWLVLVCLTTLILNFELAKSIKANEFEDTTSLNTYGMPGEIVSFSKIYLTDNLVYPLRRLVELLNLIYLFKFLKILLEPLGMLEFQVAI